MTVIDAPALDPVLDPPYDVAPDPEEYLAAAMRWHFAPDTGSEFWLRIAERLDFDPRSDIRSFADLARFPDVSRELKEARVEDLIPRGYGADPGVIGIYESGGTTGAPKRVALLRDWLDRLVHWSSAELDRHGVPQGVNWLTAVPSGPHMIGEVIKRQTAYRGGITFPIDLDPRWVKKLISQGKGAEADAYGEHIVDQIRHLLRTQDVGVLMITPPVLERISRDEELCALVAENVAAINRAGTQMDADTRELYRSEIFPETVLYSGYGSTMILGNASERPEHPAGQCVYDPYSPFMSFDVVDPDAPDTSVAYGERGQVVMRHVSRSLFLPHVLERDLATRIEPLPGQVGDSVADIAPVVEFDDQAVIEGVY